MAEVEDYKRVAVLTRTEDAVTGPAVADMIHLLAELIENATLFSPSSSRVEVRAERVANGFAVEIDDRGLGIAPDQLAEINRQLAGPPDFDLANADRLGLFVGGRLAARHGVRVSLRPSPFGGTTAIVLMPNAVIVPAPEPAAEPQPDLTVGRPARLDLRAAEAATVTAAPEPAGQPLTRQAAASPGAGVAADAGTAAEAGTGGAGAGAGTYRGLPRRTRQASLSPHLRDSSSPAARPGAAEAAAGFVSPREPEQARSLAASLQSGWRRGREDDPPDTRPAAAPAAAQTDPEAPRGEEAQ